MKNNKGKWIKFVTNASYNHKCSLDFAARSCIIFNLKKNNKLNCNATFNLISLLIFKLNKVQATTNILMEFCKILECISVNNIELDL